LGEGEWGSGVFVILFCGIGRDELQDKKGWAGWCLYICPMFFSHTTKFFVGPTSGCYGLQVTSRHI
jgi:hypothetical protein